MYRLAAITTILAAIFATHPLHLPAQSSRTNPGLLDTSEPIPYFLEDGRGVAGYRDSDRDLAKMALEAWARENGGKLKIIEAKGTKPAVGRVPWGFAHERPFG